MSCACADVLKLNLEFQNLVETLKAVMKICAIVIMNFNKVQGYGGGRNFPNFI